MKYTENQGWANDVQCNIHWQAGKEVFLQVGSTWCCIIHMHQGMLINSCMQDSI